MNNLVPYGTEMLYQYLCVTAAVRQGMEVDAEEKGKREGPPQNRRYLMTAGMSSSEMMNIVSVQQLRVSTMLMQCPPKREYR